MVLDEKKLLVVGILSVLGGVLGGIWVHNVAAGTGVVIVDDSPANIFAEYNRLQAAIRNAPSGGTVFVAPGRYDAPITINRSLRVVGIPGGERPGPGYFAPVISGGPHDNVSKWAKVGVSIASGIDVTVTGMEIRHIRYEGIYGSPAGNTPSGEVSIADNHIHHINVSGIYVTRGHRNWDIRDNRIGEAQRRIRLVGVTGVTIVDNMLYGNQEMAERFGPVHSDGIRIEARGVPRKNPGALVTRDIVVCDNTITGPIDDDGVQLQAYSRNNGSVKVIEDIQICDNTIRGVQFGMYYYANGSHATISNVSVAGNTIRVVDNRPAEHGEGEWGGGVQMLSEFGGTISNMRFTESDMSGPNLIQGFHMTARSRGILDNISIQRALIESSKAGFVFASNGGGTIGRVRVIDARVVSPAGKGIFLQDGRDGGRIGDEVYVRNLAVVSRSAKDNGGLWRHAIRAVVPNGDRRDANGE